MIKMTKKIIVTSYNPEWPIIFEKEALLLQDIILVKMHSSEKS